MYQGTPYKIADVLKSLWRLEISLRKAALNGIPTQSPVSIIEATAIAGPGAK